MVSKLQFSRGIAAWHGPRLRDHAFMYRLQTGATPQRDPSPVAVLILLCGCVLFPGCASTPNQAQLKFLETRELDLPYSNAYDAALNAVFSMGLTITHTDKGSGVISAQSGDHAQRAMMSASVRAEHPVKKVTLMVRPRTDGTTQLRMKVLINEEQQLDRKLMTKIWQGIEREAMLDAPPNPIRATRYRHTARRPRSRR